MAYQAVELGRPDPAALDQAISDYKAALASGSGREAMDAMLVIIGEACAQLGDDDKPREEVIAALVARGLPRAAGEPIVDKAVEIVDDAKKTDARSTGATGGGVGMLALIVVVGAIVAFVIFR